MGCSIQTIKLSWVETRTRKWTLPSARTGSVATHWALLQIEEAAGLIVGVLIREKITSDKRRVIFAFKEIRLTQRHTRFGICHIFFAHK